MIVAFEPRSSDIISDFSMMLQIATVCGRRAGEGEHSLEKGAKLWERSFRLEKRFGPDQTLAPQEMPQAPDSVLRTLEFSGDPAFPRSFKPCVWGEEGEQSGLGVQASILRMRVV